MRNLLDLIAEFLLVTLLAFGPLAYGAVQPWAEFTACGFAAALALIVTLRLIIDDQPLGRARVLLPIALYLLLIVIQLLSLPTPLLRLLSPGTIPFRSELLSDIGGPGGWSHITFYRLATLHDLRIILIASIVFCTVYFRFNTWPRLRRLLTWVTIIGTAIAALALAQDLTHARAIYWHVPTSQPPSSGPFVNHSHYAQFINLAMGCALALLLSTGWRKAWWTIPLLLLGGVTIPLSMTRGGMISILVAGAFTIFILLLRAQTRRLALGVMIIAVLAFAGVGYLGFVRVAGTFNSSFDSGAYAGRWQMAKDAALIWRNFPVAGIGLGAHEYVFPAFERQIEYTSAAYVENEYAQSLEETGVIGFALILIFLAMIWTRWACAIRCDNSTTRGAAAGLSYGLLAVMVHSFSDYGQHLIAVAIMSALTCAAIAVLNSPQPTQWRRHSWITIPVLFIAGWMVFSSANAWRADVAMSSARDQADRLAARDWNAREYLFDGLLQTANRALVLQPGDVFCRQRILTWWWRSIAAANRTPTGEILLTETVTSTAQRIVDDLNQTRQLCPTYAPLYLMLGQLELNFLQNPAGEEHVQTAYRLDKNDPTTCMIAGQLDARAGRWPQASEKFRRALILDASQRRQVAELYLNTFHRPDLALQVMDGDVARLYTLNEVAIQAGNSALSNKVIDAVIKVLQDKCRDPNVSSIYPAQLAQQLYGRERYAEAEPYAARAVAGYPSAENHLVYGRILAKLGRLSEARQQALAALRAQPGYNHAQALLDSIPTTKP